MALTSAKRASWEEKEAASIKVSKGTIEYKDSLELSVQSEPTSGLLKYIRKSRGGSFVYSLTNDHGITPIYSNEELDVREVENHVFRISTAKDGAKFTWWE